MFFHTDPELSMGTLLQHVFYVSLAMSLSTGSDLRYNLDLDIGGVFRLDWSIDYKDQVVQFRLRVLTQEHQWFAFGFSNYGQTRDADLVVAWTDGGHTAQFVDAHTDTRGLLIPDHQQDYHLTSFKSASGTAVIDFCRKFDTGDTDDYALDTGTTHIVYVLPQHLMSGHSPFWTDLAGVHDMLRVQLLKPNIYPPTLPSDTWVLEVRVPNITIPNKETTYWWHTALLPELTSKHHIIQYESAIVQANADVVHHMELFHCQVPADVQVPDYSGPSLEETKPTGLNQCKNVIGSWAMGAQPFTYPDETGYPLGGPGFSRYVLLEIHFNNPRRFEGRVDSSGLRFYVTSQPRQYDAGIMELGLEYTDKMAIPPGQKDFKLAGYCVQSCLNQALPVTGINVFGSQLHTHLTGRRVMTMVSRRGKPLRMLNQDRHYSSHFQEIRRLQPAVHVNPGDELITVCDFDTRSRRNVTVGGFSIADEMCLNYIHYYPKVDLEVCKSSVDTNALGGFFNDMNIHDGSRITPSMSPRVNYQNIHWNSWSTAFLKLLYFDANLNMQCLRSDGTVRPGVWNDVTKPDEMKTVV